MEFGAKRFSPREPTVSLATLIGSMEAEAVGYPEHGPGGLKRKRVFVKVPVAAPG